MSTTGTKAPNRGRQMKPEILAILASGPVDQAAWLISFFAASNDGREMLAHAGPMGQWARSANGAAQAFKLGDFANVQAQVSAALAQGAAASAVHDDIKAVVEVVTPMLLAMAAAAKSQAGAQLIPLAVPALVAAVGVPKWVYGLGVAALVGGAGWLIYRSHAKGF